MPRIVIDNFRDFGLTPDWVSKGAEYSNAKKASDGYALTMTNVSPFISPGFLRPGRVATESGMTNNSVITTKITAFTTQQARGNSQTAAYGIGGDILYQITGNPAYTITNNTPTVPTWPHTIGSAVNTDGDVHDIHGATLNIGGTSTYCLLYSYNVASGGAYLGRFDVTNNSNWGVGNSSDTAYTLTTNDVLNDANSLSVGRPMVIGTNKIAYIGAGYKVDSLDLTTSSAAISLNAIDIDREYEIQSLAFYKGFLVMAAHMRSAEAGILKSKVAVFFWDTFSTSFTDPVYIDDDRCGALYQNGDTLVLFTSNGAWGNLREWDGEDFVIKQQIAKEIPLHGSVERYREGIVWGDSTGKGWYYGSVDGGARRLWQWITVGDAITCMKRLNQTTTETLHIAGIESTTDEYLKYVTTAASTTSATPSCRLSFQDIPHRSTITRIEAHCLPLATDASVAISIATNMTTSSPTAYGTISYSTDGAITKKVFKERLTDVSQMVMLLEWTDGVTNTVALERLIIDYETPATKSSS